MCVMIVLCALATLGLVVVNACIDDVSPFIAGTAAMTVWFAVFVLLPLIQHSMARARRFLANSGAILMLTPMVAVLAIPTYLEIQKQARRLAAAGPRGD